MITVPAFADRRYSFPPEKTALLLIDMQRDFVENAEANGDSSAVQAIVPALRELLQAARAAGLTIAHTREGHVPDLSDLNAAKRERSRDAGAEIGARGALGRYLIRGEYGHDFIDDLRPDSGEWIIDKPGFGAFYATDLDLRLRTKGITHLIVGGVTTQCCVQSTLREAVDRGYRCLTLADGCASFDMALHDASMAIIQSEGHLFGWIAICADLARALRGG